MKILILFLFWHQYAGTEARLGLIAVAEKNRIQESHGFDECRKEMVYYENKRVIIECDYRESIL